MDGQVSLVTGGREWALSEPIESALTGARWLIVGDAQGADLIALLMALEKGVMPVVLCASRVRFDAIRVLLRAFSVKADVQLVADWRVDLKEAGTIRNGRMVRRAVNARQRGLNVHCYAFPGPKSKGTWNCTQQCLDAGFKVHVCDWLGREALVPAGTQDVRETWSSFWPA